MSRGDFLNYSSCSMAAQLLSIPSQQPDPPKHSTPKKGGEADVPPQFDASSICDEFDLNSIVPSTAAAGPHRTTTTTNKVPLTSEKAILSSYLDGELQKRSTAALSNSNAFKENISDAFNRRIDLISSSSRDTTATGSLAFRKMLKFEPPHLSRPPSCVSDVDTISSMRTASKLAFERGKERLNFYCVKIGECLMLRLRVWNIDSVQMRIRCSISNEGGMDCTNFKVIEVTAPIMEPGMQCEIAIQYKPTRVERNFAQLVVERINCEYFRKTFQLVGDGGRAEVALTEANFSEGVAVQTSSSQAVVIQPDDLYHFWLEFENRGQRPAYVKLVTINHDGKRCSSDQIYIKPDQFVLGPSGDENSRRKVSVRVIDMINCIGASSSPMDALITIGGQQQQRTKEIGSGKRASSANQRESIGTDGGRESLMSSSSAATISQQVDCAFRIETYWGEEYQRQRLKCWKRKFKRPEPMKGITFTDQFDGEQPMSIHQRQKIGATLTDSEIAEFQNSLRQLTLNVVSVQAANYFPPPDMKHPIIELYRNQSQLLRETIPEEESYYNASATIGFPNF